MSQSNDDSDSDVDNEVKSDLLSGQPRPEVHTRNRKFLNQVSATIIYKDSGYI